MHAAFAGSVLVVVAAALPAQRTWIVDRDGGGDFSDLPAAVAVATHDDVLVVRAGTYSPFATDQGIAVLGQGSVRIAGRVFNGAMVDVRGLPGGRTFSMRNIEVEQSDTAVGVALSDNPGRVHLHEVVVEPAGDQFSQSFGAALEVRASRQVLLNESFLLGGVGADVVDASLVATSSTIAGGSARSSFGGSLTPSSVALQATRSWVHLSRTMVRGGNGADAFFQGQPPRSAIVAEAAAITITGNATTHVSAGRLLGAAPLAAIVASGSLLHLDPAVVVEGSQGGPRIESDVGVTVRSIVSLAATGGRLAGPVRGEVVSVPGDLVSLLVSTPADPLLTPFGLLYLDPKLTFTVFIGATQGPGGQLPFALSFPDLPELRGVTAVFQAANVPPGTTLLELSNPVALVLD